MTTETQVRLEALRNRSTKYELVMMNVKTGERLRLCYTARKNRRGLVDAIRQNGPDLARVTSSEEFMIGKGPVAVLDDWTIRFSGRTQRDAIASGAELKWFREDHLPSSDLK